MKNYELISHTADLQIRVYAKNEIQLFTNALVGMFQVIKPITTECIYKNEILVCEKLNQKHDFAVISNSIETLLIDFLNEALYLSDVNNEAYFDVDFVQFSKSEVKGTLHGIQVQGFDLEIKAVTYSNLVIKKENDLLITDIVFDI